jgi:hypothetical protein
MFLLCGMNFGKLVLVNWHPVVEFAVPCMFLIVIQFFIPDRVVFNTYVSTLFTLPFVYLSHSVSRPGPLFPVFIFHSFREFQLSYLCNTFLHEYTRISAVNFIFSVHTTIELVADHTKLYRRKVPLGSWTTSSKNCEHFPACFCQLLQIFLAPGRDRCVTCKWDDVINYNLFCNLSFDHFLKWECIWTVTTNYVTE